MIKIASIFLISFLLFLPSQVNSEVALELLVTSEDRDGRAFEILDGPAMNSRGQFLYAAKLGSGRFPDNVLYLRSAGGERQVAANGGLTPLPPGNVEFTNQSFGFGGPRNLRLTDQGNGAFFFPITTKKISEETPPLGDALWVMSGGALKYVFSDFAPIPGPAIPGGALWFWGGKGICEISDGGWFMISGVTQKGPNNDPPLVQFMAVGHGGSIEVVAAAGLAAPGIEGGIIKGVGSTSYVAGFPEIGYLSTIVEVGGESLNVVYMVVGSSLEPAVIQGRPLPGMPEGVEYPQVLSVDKTGNALIWGSTFTNVSKGFWSHTLFGLRKVLLFDESIETPDGELVIHEKTNNGFAEIRGDRVTFHGSFSGLGFENTLGILQETGDSFRIVSAKGIRIPGTIYEFDSFPPGTYFSVNESGQIAFNALFRNTETNQVRHGLFLEDEKGNPNLVVALGDTLSVGGEDRIVQQIVLDYQSALTDSGILGFRILFKDGSSAIYRAFIEGFVQASGSIFGHIKSLIPVETEKRDDVHRAVVTVYPQLSNRLKGRAAFSSDEDFTDYLAGNLGEPVATVVLDADDEGDFFFSPLNAIKDNWEGGLRDQLYTVFVSNGETEQAVLDAMNEPIPGETETVFFFNNWAVNVPVDEPEITIQLDRSLDVEIKRNLAETLTRLSPQNWKDVEAPVLEYLNALDADLANLTDEKVEGLLRGIMVERAFRIAFDYADPLLEISLGGLANLIADVIGRIADYKSDALSQAEQRQANAFSSPADSEFNTDVLSDDVVKQILADQQLIGTEKLVDAISTSIGIMAPFIELAMVKAGIPAEDAATISTVYTTVIGSFLTTVKDKGLNGWERGGNVIKALIQEAIKTWLPSTKVYLLDSSPDLKVSFAYQNSELLNDSMTAMMNWNASDKDVWQADQRLLWRRVDNLNSTGANGVYWMQWALEGAGILGQAETILSIFGSAVKWVEALEGIAEIGKYVGNLVAFVGPLVMVYDSLPDEMEVIANIAFHDLPGTSSATESSSLPSLQSDTVERISPAMPAVSVDFLTLPSLDEAVALTNQMIKAVQTNDMGAGANVFANKDGENLMQAFQTWISGVDRLIVGATSCLVNAGLDSNLFYTFQESQLQRADLLVSGAIVDTAVQETFAGVLSGSFNSPQDPEFLTAKTTLLDGLNRLKRSMTRVQDATGKLYDAIAEASQEGARKTLLFESVSLASAVTGEQVINDAPEEFLATFQAVNMSPVDLPSGSVELALFGLPIASIISDAVQVLPALTPGQTANLEWTIRVDGELEAGMVGMVVDRVDIPEEVEPVISIEANQFLPVSPKVWDADFDTMADSFETEYGLDLESDDSQEDNDEDGIVNVDEFNLGTSPIKKDSDGDGIDDYDELFPPEGIAPTDPTLADTDGDGVSDGVDRSPRDMTVFIPEGYDYDRLRVNAVSPDPLSLELSWFGTVGVRYRVFQSTGNLDDFQPISDWIDGAGNIEVFPATPGMAKSHFFIMEIE